MRSPDRAMENEDNVRKKQEQRAFQSPLATVHRRTSNKGKL